MWIVALTLARRMHSFLILLALLLAGPSVLYPQATTRGKPLVGLWGTEQSFGPLVRGTLTIDARQAQCRAAIGGFEVSVKRNGDRLSFSLPNGVGEFRGRLDPTSNMINGQWIQPIGVVNNNRYATPVRLVAVSTSVWTAGVVPLDDHVSFYVSIRSQPNGSITAVIINPEFNLFRRRSYDVALNGSNVTFTNPKRPQDHFNATYDKASDRLFLTLLDSYPPLPLSRRDRGDALGFYARTPDTAKYTYTRPIAGDGWPTTSLAEVGISEKPIAALIEKILTADPTDNPVDIDSLLIARHGKLVLEEYFHGFDKERPHDMRSASKTFAPILVGIARDRGINLSPDTPIYPLFPEDKPFPHWDTRKNHVTVKALMTMTSGFACDDNDDASPGNEDNMQSQTAQPDWYKYTLDLPMAAEPGGRHAVYCSADLNLVGGTVAHGTHSWLPEFFERYLARPLQFGTYHMNLMPTGEAYMGGGLYLRPRDELKLGQLYLAGGIWHATRIVSEDWVRQSTTAYSTFDSQTDYDAPHEYGFGWHINRLHVGDRVFRAYSAGGNGGQIVIVIPDLDLVVSINGGSYGEFTKWYRWGLQLVPQNILPALSQKDELNR
ncbi:MAG TPA: serine hydrolase [Blastocatellia bacterium]|nr:serine hydrolase [Blastocatellia bacterium]